MQFRGYHPMIKIFACNFKVIEDLKQMQFRPCFLLRDCNSWRALKNIPATHARFVSVTSAVSFYFSASRFHSLLLPTSPLPLPTPPTEMRDKTAAAAGGSWASWDLPLQRPPAAGAGGVWASMDLPLQVCNVRRLKGINLFFSYLPTACDLKMSTLFVRFFFRADLFVASSAGLRSCLRLIRNYPRCRDREETWHEHEAPGWQYHRRRQQPRHERSLPRHRGRPRQDRCLRYLVDFFRLDINVWDTSSSNQSSWPLLHLRHSISKLS